MLSKSKKLPKFYRYLIFSLFFITFILISLALLISKYPIKSTTTNLNNAHYSKFFSPWPTSTLDIEYQERKRLKRYAKSEQKKRMEKQLQKMNILSVPIYDLSLDDQAEVIANNTNYFPNKTDILWPIFPLNKKYINQVNPTITRRSVNILMPNRNWTSIFEGVYLSSGDEIKANIPLTKERRYLNFLVFPLTPGNIRVLLGQYVWAKTFDEEEVHKSQKITIPINDSSAVNIRVLSISCSCYIEDLSVNQTLKNGREPIKVALSSPLWLPDKNLLTNKFEDDNILDNEDIDLSSDDNQNQDDVADTKPEETKIIPTENTQVKTVNLESEDPLLQVANKQILVDKTYSTAFGYNLVFIQTPPIENELLKNKKLLINIAPNLSTLMDSSIYFDKSIKTFETNSDIFRQTIFPNYVNLFDNNPTIFQYKIEHNDIENTYQKFRRYGYKVVTITVPESLFFSKELANNNKFSNLNNRWLDTMDWEFQNRNLRIDAKSETSSGLDAIFNLDNSKKIPPPLNQHNYNDISDYLTEVSKNINTIPNWHPNEYMLIANKNYYTAKVVDAFQNWTGSYPQNRFFAHILFDGNTVSDRPNLINLKKAVSSAGLFSLSKPKYISQLAQLSHLDMGIGEILNTIKARRIENRTLVFLLIPDKKNSGQASGIYKIPGLIPKKHAILSDKDVGQYGINDLLATIFSNIGIPSGRNINTPSHNSQDGNMIESKPYTMQTTIKKLDTNFLKFTLLLKPNSNLCSPILWKSNISSLFGIQSNYPIYRIIDNNTLEIYPCSIPNKLIELTWFQNNFQEPSSPNPETDNGMNEIGGNFFYFKNKKDFPEIYFGKSLISSQDLIFMFKNLTQETLHNIFYVDEPDLQKTLSTAKESLSALDNLNNEKNSKAALFVTPL